MADEAINHMNELNAVAPEKPFFVHGDNGTSPEGTQSGTFNQYTAYNGILDVPLAAQMKAYDTWGSASAAVDVERTDADCSRLQVGTLQSRGGLLAKQ
jgi:hypothetical protein